MNISADRMIQWSVDTSRRVFPWVRNKVEAWAGKTRDLWGRPDNLSKGFAIVWAIGGIIVLAYAAYILVFLIPIIIGIAFVAAILAAVKGNRL